MNMYMNANNRHTLNIAVIFMLYHQYVRIRWPDSVMGYHCIAGRALFRYRDVSVMAVFMYCPVRAGRQCVSLDSRVNPAIRGPMP